METSDTVIIAMVIMVIMCGVFLSCAKYCGDSCGSDGSGDDAYVPLGRRTLPSLQAATTRRRAAAAAHKCVL